MLCCAVSEPSAGVELGQASSWPPMKTVVSRIANNDATLCDRRPRSVALASQLQSIDQLCACVAACLWSSSSVSSSVRVHVCVTVLVCESGAERSQSISTSSQDE